MPYIESIQFSIGTFTIHTWGLFAALGVALASILVYLLAKRRGLSESIMLDCIFWSLLGGWVGARLAYVLNEWSLFADRPLDALKIWEGGIASWGGLVGAVIAITIVLHKRGHEFWKYADVLAVGLPLGFGCGRIGCSLIHDHLGRETTSPFGMTTPDGTIRHEPSYYLVLFNAVLFVYLLRKFRKNTSPPGVIFRDFVIVYALGRLFFDTFRANDLPIVDPRLLDLTIAQWFFIGQVILGIGLIIFLRKKKQQGISPAS